LLQRNDSGPRVGDNRPVRPTRYLVIRREVAPSGGFTPLKFLNQDPLLLRQSDLRQGARIDKLPFDDRAKWRLN